MENQNNQLAVVQKGLENFNNLKKELVEMQSTSKELMFTNFDDKDNNNKIVETRKLFKSKRVEIEKAGKLLRDQINPVIKEILSKEKELIAVIEPEEKRLLEIEKSIESDKEAKRLEKERAEMERVQNRINKMLEYGVVGDFYVVKNWSDEQFEEEMKVIIRQHEIELAQKETERLHAEQLERERIEQERIEREAMEAERVEQEKIQQEQEAKAMELKLAEAKMELEKRKLVEDKRIAVLKEFWTPERIGTIEHLGSMSDDDFEKLRQFALAEIEHDKQRKMKEEAEVKERMAKLRQERIAELKKYVPSQHMDSIKNIELLSEEDFQHMLSAFKPEEKIERFPADDEHKETTQTFVVNNDALNTKAGLQMFIEGKSDEETIELSVSSIKNIINCIDGLINSNK